MSTAAATTPTLKHKTRKLKSMLLMSHLTPLPIYDVGHDVDTNEHATGEFGCVFPHVDHRVLDEPETAGGCPVGSAEVSRRLANAFTELEARFWKRVNAGTDRVLVYQRPNSTSVSKEYISTHNDPSNLSFNSWFESGNLECAYRVHHRNYATYLPQCTKHLNQTKLATPKSSAHHPHGPPPPTDVLMPVAVDQEYDLYCDCDTYTFGHIQWYYFQVKVADQVPPGQDALVVRFNIRNMMKRDSLYNFGMLPTVYSEVRAAQGVAGWTHAGVEAFYYQNADEFEHPRRRWRTKRYHYTLSFVYRFDTAMDTVYFAHCYPYTYTHLQRYLTTLLACPLRSPNVRRRTLCPTVCGNACDVLTITEYTAEPRVLMLRTGVVLTARVHPGETNGSFVMQGIIDYLTGPSKEAQRLRQCFVFKIVPMLNPDGVIHGNYRCSVVGVDLNRRWSKPCQNTHPTIYAAKQMIMSMRNARRVVLFCDIHGHSRKKNMFVYGCKPYFAWSPFEAAKMRLFPYLLSKVSSAEDGGFFSFPDCTFNVPRSKLSTGRVSVWNDIRILNSFTLETSFCGTGENQTRQYHRPPPSTTLPTLRAKPTTHYRVCDLIQSGEKFCCALGNYGRLLGIEPVDEASLPPDAAPAAAGHGESAMTLAVDEDVMTTGPFPSVIRNRHRHDTNNDDNNFVLSADAIQLLDEISTNVPLSADVDCNSSEGSAGSDSNPSEDNKDIDEIEADTRWQAFVRHRAAARPRIARRSPPCPIVKDDASISPPTNSLVHRPSAKNVLKALPRTPPRPTTVSLAPEPTRRGATPPVRVKPAPNAQPTVVPLSSSLPQSRRMSVWAAGQGRKDVNAAIAGLHRELIKRRISLTSPPKHPS